MDAIQHMIFGSFVTKPNARKLNYFVQRLNYVAKLKISTALKCETCVSD